MKGQTRRCLTDPLGARQRAPHLEVAITSGTRLGKRTLTERRTADSEEDEKRDEGRSEAKENSENGKREEEGRVSQRAEEKGTRDGIPTQRRLQVPDPSHVPSGIGTVSFWDWEES
ncbi:hypothetical protein NDU88_006798 [Pleurodeles waltl]|uniref:Uncharacterized protein n=1 Tax=Pleurodeles waltl TaxID=8319 RepID=A0AAV7VRP7_PLEWA|nr:hypothetical protein NDU88_006798 [Pleurodeles waltl]